MATAHLMKPSQRQRQTAASVTNCKPRQREARTGEIAKAPPAVRMPRDGHASDRDTASQLLELFLSLHPDLQE